MSSLKKYIGNKAFYKTVVILIIPMIIQSGITNFVNLLDNLMVGKLGTEPMSAVAIVNQLIFVFNLLIFGGLSGASIYGAQFFGVKNHDGLRGTVRFRIVFCIISVALSCAILAFFGDSLAMLFLNNESNAGLDLSVTLGYAKSYLSIILWGLLPFAVTQVYSGALREAGQTVAPMVSSVIAIIVNLVLNWLLIFGKLGLPAMGVAGAALATVIARYVEMCYLVMHSHLHKDRYPFFEGLYKSLRIPASLARDIIVRGWPLMLNELMWALGTTFVNQNYSTRGLTVVAATNITVTAWQLFCIIMFSMGNAVAIIVGQRLGAGEIEQARDEDRKLIFLTTVSHIVIGGLIILCAPFIPLLYNTEPEVRQLATKLLIIAGASLPINATIHVIYFTIRSGGKTFVTFLFDSGYTWCISVVLSYILCRFTSLPIVVCYLIVQISEMLKLVIGIPMLRSGFWAKNVINEVSLEESGAVKRDSD